MRELDRLQELRKKHPLLKRAKAALRYANDYLYQDNEKAVYWLYQTINCLIQHLEKLEEK